MITWTELANHNSTWKNDRGSMWRKTDPNGRKVNQAWPITSRWICPLSLQFLPLVSIPVTLTYLLRLKHRKPASHVQSFLLLFSLRGTAFPSYLCSFLSSLHGFTYLLSWPICFALRNYCPAWTLVAKWDLERSVGPQNKNALLG